MKKSKKILFKFVLFIGLIIFQNIKAEYIADPVLLVHGRGAHGGDWEDIHNGQSTKMFLQKYFPNNKGIYNYSFSDNMDWGYNWGRELYSSIIPTCKNDYYNDYNLNANKIRIIAHSAGGLAAREYVTSNYYNNDIKQIIMLGTPNQGAHMAIMQGLVDFGYHNGIWMAAAYAGLGATTALIPGLQTYSGMCYNAANFYIGYYAAALLIKIIFNNQDITVFGNIDRYLNPQNNYIKNLNNREPKPKSVEYRTLIGKEIYPTWTFLSSAIALDLAIEIISDLTFGAIKGLEALSGWNADFLTRFWGEFSLPDRIIRLLVELALIFATSSNDGDGIVPGYSQRGAAPPPILGLFDYDTKAIPSFQGIKSIEVKATHCFNPDLDETRQYDSILKLLDDPSSLAVENSNTITAVKMEPDGCYVNIQKPEIHIDGSCDDYLIQWMGDNDRVRLRYDKFSNIDEVIKLKNTEEGVFDCG